MDTTLHSIGHGRKSVQEFIEELRSFGIRYLVDVRSMPYSKWSPEFNKPVIEEWLPTYGIKYYWWGDSIGGRPTETSDYDEEGHFDYKRMASRQTFQKGLERLVAANDKQCRVAVMCSESDPSLCHRSKLIGRELYAQEGIDMLHILKPGKAIRETEILEKLSRKEGKPWQSEPNIFGEKEEVPYFRSRTSYAENNEDPANPYD